MRMQPQDKRTISKRFWHRKEIQKILGPAFELIDGQDPRPSADDLRRYLSNVLSLEASGSKLRLARPPLASSTYDGGGPVGGTPATESILLWFSKV